MKKIIAITISLIMIFSLSACVGENVSNKIKELTDKVEEMQNKIDTLQKQNDEQNKMIDDLSKEVNDQKLLIEEQGLQIEKLQSINHEQQSRADRLQSTISTLQNQIFNQEKLIDNQNKAINTQNVDISDLKKTTTSIKNELSIQKADNTNLENRINSIEAEKDISILITRYEKARHSIISNMFSENAKARESTDGKIHGISSLSLGPMYTNYRSEVEICTTENVYLNSIAEIEKFESDMIAEITNNYDSPKSVTYYFSDLCSDFDGNCYAIVEREMIGPALT